MSSPLPALPAPSRSRPYFDKTINRWRDRSTGNIVKAPEEN
jgi:hypothetical protein